MQRSFTYKLLLSDTALGYLTWSMISQFYQFLFFYPLVKMRFMGIEVLLFIPLLSTLLTRKDVKQYVQKYQARLFAISSIAYWIASYQPNAALAICCLCVALGVHWLTLMGIWWNKRFFGDLWSVNRKECSMWGTLLGLVIFLCARMAYSSLDPIFILPEGRVIGILVMLAACWGISSSQSEISEESKKEFREVESTWWVSAAAFGCIWFMIQFLFAEHGIVARWTDVKPYPSGILIILSVSLGIVISRYSWVTHLVWFWIGGIFGSLLLYYAINPVISFTGGLLIGAYIFSVFEIVVDSALTVGLHVGKFFSVSGLVMILLQLASIFVVAYPFVPLGWLFRERPHYILFFVISIIGFVVMKERHKRTLSPQHNQKVLVVLSLILLFILTPTILYRETKTGIREPYQPKEEIRAMAWAFHFGYDNFGLDNFYRARNFVKNYKVDILGIVESDLSRIMIGNRDIVEFFESELQMYSDFGSPTRDSTWGCALLSVYPIIRSNRIILPSPEGELACLIDATVQINRTKVDIIVTHFGNTEHTLDLRLQTEALEKLLIQRIKKTRKMNPLILLSYLTLKPFSQRYYRFINTGTQMRDTGTFVKPVNGTGNEDDRYCLYVLYRDLKLLNWTRVYHEELSDTEGQLATFKFYEDANYN